MFIFSIKSLRLFLSFDSRSHIRSHFVRPYFDLNTLSWSTPTRTVCSVICHVIKALWTLEHITQHSAAATTYKNAFGTQILCEKAETWAVRLLERQFLELCLQQLPFIFVKRMQRNDTLEIAELPSAADATRIVRVMYVATRLRRGSAVHSSEWVTLLLVILTRSHRQPPSMYRLTIPAAASNVSYLAAEEIK